MTTLRLWERRTLNLSQFGRFKKKSEWPQIFRYKTSSLGYTYIIKQYGLYKTAFL